MEVWEKREKKLKGNAAFARACVRVGLSAWGGARSGNGGDLTLALNNGIKDAVFSVF